MTDATLTENARWWFDALAVIKTRAADTNGQLTIIEVTEPPNAEAPLHVHHHEDEGFYVLAGDVTIHVGDNIVEAGPGDFAFGPRDIPHRYTVGRDGCRMLFICTPGGFEDLVIGMSRPAESLRLPPSTTRSLTGSASAPSPQRTAASSWLASRPHSRPSIAPLTTAARECSERPAGAQGRGFPA